MVLGCTSLPGLRYAIQVIRKGAGNDSAWSGGQTVDGTVSPAASNRTKEVHVTVIVAEGERRCVAGYFDEHSREYFITDPRTRSSGSITSARASLAACGPYRGALICKDDPTFNRITKYIHRCPPQTSKRDAVFAYPCT